MLAVSLLFIFVAGLAFLGFIINALFDRLNITKVLPLMLIGLLVGPVLHIVPSGAQSTVATLTPYITAVAIAFILFDVGLNINIFKLGMVLKKATEFTFVLGIVSGLVLAGVAFTVLHWSVIESLIFGFALSGPSSAIVPTLMKFVDTSQELKTTLVYESVISDTFQLVVPLLLFEILAKTNITLASVGSLVAGVVVGSIVLGGGLAFIWLYLLNKFRNYSKEYTWTLTITIVVATYGIAQWLDFNGALAIFTFGIMFANIGGIILKNENLLKERQEGDISKSFNALMKKYFFFDNIKKVKDYQKEIEFFTSTFFFVYIGLLFNISAISLVLVLVGVAVVVIMVLLRRAAIPIIKDYLSNDAKDNRSMKRIVSFNVARGMSPAIIATLPLALGISIPGFLDQIFLIILFSNIASTIGVVYAYRS